MDEKFVYFDEYIYAIKRNNRVEVWNALQETCYGILPSTALDVVIAARLYEAGERSGYMKSKNKGIYNEFN